MKYFLSIAASDSSGGAGVQQDIKVAHDLGYWALSAITGITSQDFYTVAEVKPINPKLLQTQIEQCLSSFNVLAIKIGVVCSRGNILVIADCLQKYHCKNVVLDPVLTSTCGKSLLTISSIDLLKNILFPLTTLITPNKPEFETLTNCKIDNIEGAIDLAKHYCNRWNTSILLKGGHFNEKNIKEALITKSHVYRFERERKKFTYQHGTGCTLSSALACFLGENLPLYNSYNKATEYLMRYYQSLQNKFHC